MGIGKATREEALQFVSEQALTGWEEEMRHEIVEKGFSMAESYMFQVSRMYGYFLNNEGTVPCELLQYFCDYGFCTAELMHAKERTA